MDNYALPSRCDREEEYLVEVEALGDDPQTHYETDCFCEGACACLSEEGAEAAEAQADAEYDAHVNR